MANKKQPRFEGTIKGDGPEIKATGDDISNLWVHIKGDTIGLTVGCFVNNAGEDCVSIVVSGGRIYTSTVKPLGIWQNKGGTLLKVA